MMIMVCDRCNKKIIDKDTGVWVNQKPYSVGEKRKVRIKKQLVVLKFSFSLENGEDFDLCNKCGFKIIEKKVIK